ncbi:sodium/hydrogen exchanger 9B2 isoform X2 [Manduca sexta]|uniref:sodium/hydrogen exchanger 9B2 isoform X2 n=1 Tax=Manduca sexta TaxID=7130 RepID=UPI0011832C7D|nr:sodium/hydrogen exchanger 9B2 isoform X2 [Manduca sexta]
MKEEACLLDKVAGGEKIVMRASLSDFSPSFSTDKSVIVQNNEKKKKIKWKTIVTPTCVHYYTLTILGLISWGFLWSAWGDGWKYNGEWFRLGVIVVIAWASGQILNSVTTLPPLLAALLTGILARHLDYLDMRMFPHVDGFLRKIYPVIILGKSSLAWDTNFMKRNWRQVASLGTLPWIAEVATLTVCTRFLLDLPWVWGVLLGSIYASLSCAVVMPAVLRSGVSPDRTHNWPQLVCTAGGTDTALSVGVYGIVFSYIFSDVDDTYRYIKVGLTLFVGVALGVAWGSLAGLVPHSHDYYVTELRVLFVLLGGMFANFFTLYLGWGGTAGVAVLACNATAATHWARDGWKLNNNPASTVYRVLWSALEPALFAFTGTYFVISNAMSQILLIGLGILLICLTIRLTVATVVCWGMTFREKVFICCTWTPKSIVEAVLCPLAINTLILRGDHSTKDMEYAEQLVKLIVPAILITTPIGSVLTNYLAPILLKDVQKKHRNESEA